ncbi:MAG: acyltransferase, partial [Defluviitaleaceae bacterium]|nr:acyltransferase [Defluviitaleaceae bacterium]
MTRIKWFALVRAYGLFLVLGYHLFYDIFPGGFLGVDIFFAFSGFLVTALAIEEVRKSGGFALFNFYKRRARRIIIPLFYAVVFTLPFMLLISPDFTVGIAKQTAAALGFATNWFQIFTGGSYEAQLLPSAYIHTWSLAIEMQFYITWGLLFALLAGVAKLLFEDTKKRLICFKASVLIISGTLAVSSYLYMQSMWSAGHALDVIYFDTFARFLPFFIGAFSAVVWGVQDKQDAASRLPGSHSKLIVAALIIVTVLTSAVIMYESLQYKFTDSFIYHYGFLFTSLLAVVLIYCTHGLHCMTPAEMKEPKLLTATGDLSYNAYLFHWPFYVVFSALIITSNTLASLVTLVFTFTFSALVYYGAERIFISPGHTGALKHRRAVVSAVSIAVVFSAAAGGFVMHRAPAITSIEADFAASYVMQDAGGVMSLKRGIMAVNDTPLTYTPLQANLLSVGVPMPIPAPASPPAPESAPPP